MNAVEAEIVGQKSAIIVRPHMLLVDTMAPFLRRVLGQCDVVKDPSQIGQFLSNQYDVAVVSTSFTKDASTLSFEEAADFAHKQWPNAALVVTSTVDVARLDTFVFNMLSGKAYAIQTIRPGQQLTKEEAERVRSGESKGIFLITKDNFTKPELVAELEESFADYLKLSQSG